MSLIHFYSHQQESPARDFHKHFLDRNIFAFFFNFLSLWLYMNREKMGECFASMVLVPEECSTVSGEEDKFFQTFKKKRDSVT